MNRERMCRKWRFDRVLGKRSILAGTPSVPHLCGTLGPAYRHARRGRGAQYSTVGLAVKSASAGGQRTAQIQAVDPTEVQLGPPPRRAAPRYAGGWRTARARRGRGPNRTTVGSTLAWSVRSPHPSPPIIGGRKQGGRSQPKYSSVRRPGAPRRSTLGASVP